VSDEGSRANIKPIAARKVTIRIIVLPSNSKIFGVKSLKDRFCFILRNYISYAQLTISLAG
jgi:hypothetical protein